jgi:pyruvate formate lyase activating enzyme
MLAANPVTLGKIIIRMPLIKGINDSDDLIQASGALYRETGVKQVHLLPYHSLGTGKKTNMGGIQEIFDRPSDERLKEIEAYFRDEAEMEVEIFGGL